MKCLLCVVPTCTYYVVTGWLTLEVSKKQNWGHLHAANGMSPVRSQLWVTGCALRVVEGPQKWSRLCYLTSFLLLMRPPRNASLRSWPETHPWWVILGHPFYSKNLSSFLTITAHFSFPEPPLLSPGPSPGSSGLLNHPSLLSSVSSLFLLLRSLGR